MGCRFTMSFVSGTSVGLEQAVVGRRPELAALAASLKRLEARESPMVALSGEPGIGKTRLVDELCTRADDHGHLVLSGRAAEMEHDPVSYTHLTLPTICSV